MGIGDSETDPLKVYIRFPVKIKSESQIQELHSDITIVQLPRQKSRRWCFLTFNDEETKEKVISHLKTIKINNKKIIIKPFGKKTYKKTKPNFIITNKEEDRKSLLNLLSKEEN